MKPSGSAANRRKAMKILVIGPSETKAHGGISTVIRVIRESEPLNQEFEIDVFPSYIDGSLLVRLLYSAYGYFRFLLKFRNYDLFHINTAEKGSTFRKNLYLKAIKRAGKKAIVHIHGAEYLNFYDTLSSFRKRIVDDFFHQADLVLALSDNWKKELEQRAHITTCRTLNNGVNTLTFRAAFTDVTEHKDSFLMLGRLGARKGGYDLIDAAEIAVRQNPNLKVCLAGDGDVENVRKLVAQKGLEKNITVPGWISRTEKLSYLKKASTVVLPSYYEGLPMSLLEGMAAGKAIISTTVGAIPEMITEENGILIKPGDVSALAEGLLRCSTDMDMLKSMSQKNMEKAENVFSVRRMHAQLAEYYRQVMQQDG